MKGHISIILQICISEFSDNSYVINCNKRNPAAIESNNILLEENDETINLHKEHIVQPKLGDLWEPLKHGSNSQPQNSFVTNKKSMHFLCGN